MSFRIKSKFEIWQLEKGLKLYIFIGILVITYFIWHAIYLFQNFSDYDGAKFLLFQAFIPIILLEIAKHVCIHKDERFSFFKTYEN